MQANSGNIILIGMPGSGKSTCGVVAAKLLLKNFFDTDLLIQNREGRRLQQIIDEKGLDYFARAEEEAVLSLDIAGTVIATGLFASSAHPTEAFRPTLTVSAVPLPAPALLLAGGGALLAGLRLRRRRG